MKAAVFYQIDFYSDLRYTEITVKQAVIYDSMYVDTIFQSDIIEVTFNIRR